jgi:hypothetical protein
MLLGRLLLDVLLMGDALLLGGARLTKLEWVAERSAGGLFSLDGVLVELPDELLPNCSSYEGHCDMRHSSCQPQIVGM